MLDNIKKRFPVFEKKPSNEGYSRKQYLIEYLLLGLDVGAIKTLSKKVNREFALPSNYQFLRVEVRVHFHKSPMYAHQSKELLL